MLHIIFPDEKFCEIDECYGIVTIFLDPNYLLSTIPKSFLSILIETS